MNADIPLFYHQERRVGPFCTLVLLYTGAGRAARRRSTMVPLPVLLLPVGTVHPIDPGPVYGGAVDATKFQSRAGAASPMVPSALAVLPATQLARRRAMSAPAVQVAVTLMTIFAV